MVYVYLLIVGTILLPWALFLVGFVWTYFKRTGVDNRLSIMLALDRLGNTLIGGEDEEYISTMLGRRKKERKRYAFFAMLVDIAFLVFTGQRNHCEEAYKKYGGV